MLHWARSLLLVDALTVAALVLVACSTPPPEVTTAGDASSSDTSAGTTTTVMPGTTMVDEGSSTSTTAGDTAMDTTMGVMMDTTTSETSETSETSGSTGPAPGCRGPDDCGSNEDCDEGGRCVEACGGTWGEGSYDYCLDGFGIGAADALCGADHLCVVWGDPYVQAACAQQGCANACECPPPPATGTAVVTCGQITAEPGMNDCYLACDNGEDCPDGMTCNGSGVCVTDVVPISIYGNCGNVADCMAPGFCAVTNPDADAVCTRPCANVGDCPVAAPTGGAAVPACTDVVGDEPGFECYLSCVGGVECPTGMTCINGTLCMWPD